MKKLVAALALTLVVAAVATLSLTPEPGHGTSGTVNKSPSLSFTVPRAQAAGNPFSVLEPMYVALGTTTYANANRTAIHTFNTAGATVPTTSADGLSLEGLSGVVVSLKTDTTNATAGGTLQAYIYVPDQAAWMRVADLDLTTVAATNQSWAGIWVPVSRGRVMWVPSSIGTVSGVVYMTGQVKE